MRRSLVLAVGLTLALCAPASAQAPPSELWESGSAAGAAAGQDGRSTFLFALALVAFAGAGGLAVLAIRAPRRVRDHAGADSAVPRRERSREERADRARRLLPERPRVQRPEPPVEAPPPRPEWHPRVAGPPPLPAFGPGSHSGPSAAPPPPE